MTHPNKTRPDGFPSPKQSRNLLNEADIGSGEKTPAERETDEMIKQIPPLAPPDDDELAADDDGQQDVLDIEDLLDTGATANRSAQEQSLDKDEPNSGLDELDPVPPKGS
jgi:hypothetical protein